MRQIYERILALTILCLPGFLAVYGWTLIRDALFLGAANQKLEYIPLIIGSALFLLGISLIAGFIFFHDKKRNKVQPRLVRKKIK